MENLKEKIEDMAHYDQCAHVPPLFFAQILEALRVLADATDLYEYRFSNSILPKIAGAFTYKGYPCHMRCVEHSGTMYILFCAFHNGTSGASGSNYLVYAKDEDGNYKCSTIYTSATVPDWVKRAFSEATATASYPGLLSAAMYKKLDAVYNWCVAQGMAPIS